MIDTKQLHFNKPQQLFMLSIWAMKVRLSHQIYGRGTGKSFMAALLIDMIVRTMPRATWAIQGATFQQLLTLTLPGTLEGLEQLGYRRNQHYFIGRQAPKGYTMPYWMPAKTDNFITFVRPDKMAVGFALFSQDREGSNRGPSVDGVIADESLTLNQDRFNREARATNRGHNAYFKGNFLHHGVFHFSSMPFGDKGKWLLDAGAYYEQDGYNYSKARNAIIDLQLEFLKEPDRKKKVQIWQQIYLLDQALKVYASKKGVLYAEANTFDNIANVGLQYIMDLQASMTETMFLIEVMNKHIKKIEESFYPTLDRDVHGYNGDYNYGLLDNMDYDFARITGAGSQLDRDCKENERLHIGMDFGAAINWIVVAQRDDKRNALKFIKNFYVKSPKILDHVCEDFCKYYEHHKRKEIYFWPDPAGNNRRENSEVTPVQQAMAIFKKRGWTVSLRNQGRKNIPHHDKYLLWAQCLMGKYTHLPTVVFNRINCKELLVSMEQAPAIDYGGKSIGKNKRQSETANNPKREEATDASDAADLILLGNYRHLLVGGKGLPFQTSMSGGTPITT